MVINVQGLSSAPVNQALDKGRYQVLIQGAEAIVSAQKGTPGVKLEVQVTDGPEQEGGYSPVGKKIFPVIYFPEAEGQGRTIGLSRLKKLCIAAGVSPDDNLDLSELVGKEVVVRTTQREYNGELQVEVVDYYPVKL
jgi:hypothetical protein